jgi:hypothetical protein
MNSDRRSPWWYSGEDDEPGSMPTTGSAAEPEPAADSGRADGVPVDAVPADTAPADTAPEPDAEAGGASSAMDWTALVTGAVKMVDWATERVMAPHAEHTDPAQHPECMVCRTVTLIGDPVGLMGGGQQSAAEPEAEAPDGDADDAADSAPAGHAPAMGVQPIRWIPIDESGN